MAKNQFDINSLRIATPCPAGWANMAGDDRKRFCSLCSLNVYNFSEMTAADAEALVRRSEGKVCARMFRRADGTVITRDCPVGLAAYRKKVSRTAGAALSMIIGLFWAGYGQEPPEVNIKIFTAAELNIDKKPGRKGETRLYGVLVDGYGAVIPNVMVKLVAADEKTTWSVKTNADGVFSMTGLRPGLHTLEIKPQMGFNGILINDLELEARTSHELNISLEVSSVYEVVGQVDNTTGTPINTDFFNTPPSKESLENLLQIAPAARSKPF